MTYLKFRMGDAFPSNDVLSEWIATLALAFNDLSLVATRYVADTDTAYKSFYWNRLLISHFAEAALYLHKTKDIGEVAEFVASLPDEAQDNYRKALAACEAHERELHAIRSHVFHYPELRIVEGQKRRRLMQRVLDDHQDTETMMKLGKVSEARSLFADDIAAEVFQINSGGEEKLHEVHDAISKATTPLTRFINAALDEYFVRRGQQGLGFTRVEPVDPDDWEKGWKEVT